MMEPYLLYFGRSLLAIMLLFAGSSKLADPARFQRTLTKLGFDRIATRGVAVGFAVTECIAAAITVTFPASIIGDWLVLVLVGTFVYANAAAWATGRSVPCNCFGSVSNSASLGKRGLAQTSVLALVAIYIVVRKPSLNLTAYAPTIGIRLLILAMLIGAALLVRQAARTLSALEQR